MNKADKNTTIKEFLTYVISQIVDHPQDLNIEERTIADNLIQYIINTNKEDVGKVIGKEGKIIQSIRNVTKILAIKESKQIRIEIG